MNIFQTCQETEFANYERHLSPPLNEELLNSTSSNIHSRRIPAESDFLFAYSTVPGESSFYLYKENIVDIMRHGS